MMLWGGEYDFRHPEIFKYESTRWKGVARKFIANESKKITILDVGTGTGFVPLQIAEFLKRNDVFICSDISRNVLEVCHKKVTSRKFDCDFSYINKHVDQLSLKQNSVDYITLNSVLHHIPNLSRTFEKINKLLKVNGRLIIGHEPNKSFYNHWFLWNNYRLTSYIISPKRLIKLAAKTILKCLGLVKVVKEMYRGNRDKGDGIVQEVNKILLREGLIDIPLQRNEITAIVDIHSPTAGGYHKDRGINIQSIIKAHAPNFEIEHFETYNHLCKVTFNNKFTQFYDSILKRLYPATGATFLAVCHKTEE